MREAGIDFLGRLRSFAEAFGAGGFLIVIVAVIIVTLVALWRGTGFVLLLLFLSFSVGTISQGGVVFVATLARWGCLVLLGLGIFKRPRFYGKGMLFFAFYVLLGSLFVVKSEFVVWSAQQAALLFITVLCVSVAINSYVVSCRNVDNLFKMGILAAAAWTGTSMLFVGDFLYSARLRFTTSEDIGGTAVVYAGTFFAPMVFWGIVQNRYKLWRIFSVLLAVPFVFVVILSGVRSAILGMLMIACAPLALLRGRLVRFIFLGSMVAIVTAITVGLLFVIAPDRAQFLVNRIFTTSTTGRFEMWVIAWGLCVESGLLGHGIGSAGTLAFTMDVNFHNAYLIIWYNTGLLGLLSVLLFLAHYLWKSFHLARTIQIPQLAEYSRIALGYMLGISAMGMFEGVFSTASSIGLVMLIVVANLIDLLGPIEAEQFYDYEEVELPSVDEEVPATSWCGCWNALSRMVTGCRPA